MNKNGQILFEKMGFKFQIFLACCGIQNVFSIAMKQSSLLKRKKIYSKVSFKRMILYLLLQQKNQIWANLIKLFWSTFTHDFFKDRPFHYCQQCVSIALKRCSLQKGVCKFAPKEFYEIDPCFYADHGPIL
jgi:hypothetical protein